MGVRVGGGTTWVLPTKMAPSVAAPPPSLFAPSRRRLAASAPSLASSVVTVTAKDAYGNPRTAGGDTVRAFLQPSFPLSPAALAAVSSHNATVTDLGTGSYKVSLASAAAGTYALNLTVGGFLLAGFGDPPMQWQVAPSAAPQVCESAAQEGGVRFSCEAWRGAGAAPVSHPSPLFSFSLCK